jgi:ribose-phosphate pyrophosphokinase
LIGKGAKSVRAFCTHPVLSGKAFENIEGSKITQIVTTDSIPLKQKSDKIKILSCAQLFAKAIRNTHEFRSIAALFVEK